MNAVLRKVNRLPVEWPDAAVALSCPNWLLERWTQHFGPAQAQAIAEAALREPESYVRIPSREPGSGDDGLEPTSVPGAFRVTGPAPDGLRLHDIGSQAIIPLLDLRQGQTFLDLCAAPGNKTLQALETQLKLAVACDVSFKRLQTVPCVLPRVAVDGTKPLPFAFAFNRIFVDAPCSGTGTIGRNPEIKWRVQAKDLERFHRKQVQLVENSLSVLADDGLLLYATCSLEREENEDVIAAVLERQPAFECCESVWRLPGRDPGDGFYAARLQRKLSVS